MKNCINLLFFVLIGFSFQGQAQEILEKGTVSFISSRNVYVKFASTKGINIGDSLYIYKNEELAPALVVGNKSSTSSVCTPLLANGMKVGDPVYAKTAVQKETPKADAEEVGSLPARQEKVAAAEKANPVITPEEDDAPPALRQKARGRISAGSYSNFSDYQTLHRMRYAFSYRGDHLKNSKFSTDTYITFRHTLNEWEKVQDNLGNALKVYALSAKYDFSPTSSLSFGRKINSRISSIGAADGFQYEQGLGNFIVGAIAGSRPDYSDYSFNPNLLQVGAYAGFVSSDPANFQQLTLGVIEQRNRSKTDRRFVYFQHSGELFGHLNLFSSFEMDLYENIGGEAKNTLQLTNLFVSLRYRLSRNWRFSLSYDNRKNIIYYESYKSFIDQLIDDETRQGLRLGVNYQPFRFVSLGVNSSWRFQKSGLNQARNLNAFLNFSRIPVANIRASLSANFLQANYLNSRLFGARISKDIIKGKLDGDLYFRKVAYRYASNETTIGQNIAGASLSLAFMKNLRLYLYYEGTFDAGTSTFHRFNTRVIQRF